MKLNRFLIVVAVGLSFTFGTVHAAPISSTQYETEVARCIKQAAKGRLWLEMTLWGLRDQEAGWIGAEVANRNGTYDLGVLQINSTWLPHLARMVGRSEAQVRGWLIYDPCFSVLAARWIFMSSLYQFGDYWKAVGVYHSLDLWRQRRYAISVAGHLRRRFGRNQI